MDGFRAGTYLTFYGIDADKKADKFAKAAIARANKTLRLFNLGEFTSVSFEAIGVGSQMGTPQPSTELVLKAAVKHPDKRGVGIFLKELSGMGLATPPGLSGFTGAGRARPSPVLRLFSYLTPKDQITVTIDVRGKTLTHKDKSPTKAGTVNRPSPPARVKDANVEVPLIDLAWGRSGDKGNKANIGIIARKAEYLPFILSLIHI